jgi:hypothetical protein
VRARIQAPRISGDVYRGAWASTERYWSFLNYWAARCAAQSIFAHLPVIDARG